MSRNKMEYRFKRAVNKPIRKVVVVDDVKFHLISIQKRLNDHCDIFAAQTTRELFEILKKTKPDIILLDVNMPEIDGFEVIKMLKDDHRYAEIPVVFLTAQYDRKTIKKGITLGADDILGKPYSDSNLIECIENHCDPVAKAENKAVIFAVDDNLSILKAINYLLADKYEVRTLPDPLKLSNLLSIVSPDLFLLDCNMPGMSGFDLIPIIRGFRQCEETPIIFLTSDGTADNVCASMSAGVCDFLVKPIDEKILHKKIEQHLKGFMMRRHLCKVK